MKIVFTGGGTGGHFYPIIAVAEQLRLLVEKEALADVEFHYFADAPYDEAALFENQMKFQEISAGKVRRYFSLENFTDMFKTLGGIFQALSTLFSLYPDVVFAKGGYSSFPTLVAARILGIPVVLHESDSVPGRVNKWAGRFAKRIAISWKDAAEFFPKDKTALTGQPVRAIIARKTTTGALDYLRLEEGVPIIFVFAGSQGAEKINNALLTVIPELTKKYQVIHQTGPKNLGEIEKIVMAQLSKGEYANRYRAFGFLNPLAISMAAGVSSLVISRAGSSLFEVASWGIPSIVIPISDSNGDHQRKNAFSYAREGACVVMEEKNLGPRLLVSEINRILESADIQKKMSENAKAFYKPDAAEKIAKEIMTIALSHEAKK